jgi:O-antigen ligase
MTARLDSAEWLWLVGLTLFAALIGLLAGIDPRLAIAAAMACGFVLIVFVDLGLGLALFTTFSFLEVLGTGGVVSVGKVGGILLALAWLAVVLTRPDARSDFLAVHPGMTAVIGGFLGWTLLSAVWAENPNAAAGSFGRYLLNALLFLIVFTAVRTRRQALFVAAAMVAGAVGASLFGLYLGPAPTDVSGDRLSGTGLDPNQLASALVAGIALSAAVAGNLKRYPGLRLAAVAAGICCILGIFFTVSRGGLVALGVSLVAALLYAGRWRLRIAVAAALISVVTIYYFTALAPPEARQRITQSTSGEARSKEGRTSLWEVAQRMAEANFVKGVGAGNFRTASPHYLLKPGAVARSDQIISKPLVAHNMYLEVLAEEGVIGLALFSAIIVFSLGCALRAAKEFVRRRDRGGEILARALAIGLIGMLAADFFLSQQYSKQLWLLLALGPALLSVARTESAAEAAA